MSLKGLQSLITQYENAGGGDFVKTGWLKGLKDDGDTITGRILLKGKTGTDELGNPTYDLPVYEVHQNIEIDGYNRDVNCLGDGCPYCLDGDHPSLKVYIPIKPATVAEKDPVIQVWKRGLGDIKKILSLIEEYGELNARDWKIKRIGKKGNTKTTYEFYPKDKEVIDLPETPEILGKKSWFVLDLTAEEMVQAKNGNFTLKTDSPTPTAETPSTF